jgi:oligopeptide transport system permease protein
MGVNRFMLLLKKLFIFLLVLASFLLILLLPREPVIHQPSAFHIEMDYPFSAEAYKNKIQSFFQFIQKENGFGESRTGRKVSEETILYMKRSLGIILPAFFISMAAGILAGIAKFSLRLRMRGKIQEALSWLFSSVPDFFLYMSLQYILIKLIQLGFPQITLYGHEHWYSFLLPMISLTLFPFIHMVNFTAAAMDKESGEDYIRTAYSKGLGKKRIYLHILFNCAGTLLNQAQFIMLYILSSLPIVEKLSGYEGAGNNLLKSILNYNDVSSFALMLPFLVLMFLTILASQSAKYLFMPKRSGGSELI